MELVVVISSIINYITPIFFIIYWKEKKTMAIKKTSPRVSFQALQQKHLAGDMMENVNFQVFKNTLQSLFLYFGEFTNQWIDTEKVVGNSLIDFNNILDQDYVERHGYSLPGVVVPRMADTIVDINNTTFINNVSVKGINTGTKMSDLNEVHIPLVKFIHIPPTIRGEVLLRVVVSEDKLDAQYSSSNDLMNGKTFLIKITAVNELNLWGTVKENSIEGYDLTPEFKINIYPQYIDNDMSIKHAMYYDSLYLEDGLLEDGETLNQLQYSSEDFLSKLDGELVFYLSSDNDKTAVCGGQKKYPNYELVMVRPKRNTNNLTIKIDILSAVDYDEDVDVDTNTNTTVGDNAITKERRSINVMFFDDKNLETTLRNVEDIKDKPVSTLQYYNDYIIQTHGCGDVEPDLDIIPQEYSQFSFSSTTNDEIYKLASLRQQNDMNSIMVQQNKSIVASEYASVSTLMLSDMNNTNNADAIMFKYHYFTGINNNNVIPSVKRRPMRNIIRRNKRFSRGRR